MNAVGAYLIGVLIGIDVLTNAIIGGVQYQTISCRLGISMESGGWASRIWWPAWWRTHCLSAVHEAVV